MSWPFFVVESLPAAGETTVLGGDEGHHAARVQRLGVGEHLVLTNGCGGRALCTIRTVSSGQLILAVDEVSYEPIASPRLVVVQALPKGDRGELAVELMTELGVDEIVPWQAARCITQWRGERGEKSHAKWGAAAISAGKQSRRSWFPQIASVATTARIAERLSRASGAYVLYEQATEAFSTSTFPDEGELIFVVGPEGGLTPEEIEFFVDTGAQLTRLGPTVVRTSTAGAAAVTLAAAHTGRWATT